LKFQRGRWNGKLLKVWSWPTNFKPEVARSAKEQTNGKVLLGMEGGAGQSPQRRLIQQGLGWSGQPLEGQGLLDSAPMRG
jgi:hypothetical protein